MIPVPDAVAAYDRVTHVLAQPGDVDLLVAAAAQGGMPPQIMQFGGDLGTLITAYDAYRADASDANKDAWIAADHTVREFIRNHTDIPMG